MEPLTMKQAFDRAYDLFGQGSFAGKCDLATDGTCNYEVGCRRNGRLVNHGKGATYEEAIEKAKSK